MHFVIHAMDKPDAGARRHAIIERHRAYLESGPELHGVTVLLSGPLKTDDDSAMIGSFFLVDAPSRAAVIAMVEDDPISSADVWQDLTITRVTLRQNRLAPAISSNH